MSTATIDLGSIYITPQETENTALFLQLGLPSILICHKNGAFRKRFSDQRNVKTPAFRFHVERKQFDTGAF